MTITENTGDNLPRSGVKHYYARGDAEVESCIREKMEAGMSYDDAVEACSDIEVAPEPAPASDDVNPEDVFTGLDRCIQMRTTCAYTESQEEARNYCLRMFQDPNIKSAFENDADPEIVGRLVYDWECLHHPKMKWWRDSRDRKNHARELAVEKKMDELLKKHGGIKYPLESDLRHAAEQQLDLEKYIRSHKHPENLSVGNTFGKTKEQLIKEDAEPASNKGLTVGSLFGKTRQEILADSQPEQTPLDRCVKARMDSRNESYEEALRQCKIILEVSE